MDDHDTLDGGSAPPPPMHEDSGAGGQDGGQGDTDAGDRRAYGLLTGRVFDQRTLLPIANAKVEVRGKAIATTDARGGFSAEVEVTDNAALMIHAAGFARAIEPFAISENETTFLEVQVLPVDGVAMVDPAVGGAVHGTAGATVEFGPSAFKRKDGSIVSGEVIVELTALDPSTPEGLRAFPGSFRATTFDGSTGELITVVPMDITARQGDEVLNIADDASAVVHFPIPDPDSAPAKIALWSLSEATGEWVEEGEADKIFDEATKAYVYRGVIKHMSWWNCDAFARVTCIRGCVTTQDGKPVAQARTLAEGIDFANIGEGYTGPNGCFAEDVPAGAQLRVRVQSALGASDSIVVQASGVARRAQENPGACQDVGTIKIGPVNMMEGCPAGLTMCGDRCVDLDSSAANCGECGETCDGGASCIAGECACTNSETVCDGECTNVDTSLTNCGECGNACGEGASCVAGECVAQACPEGTIQCLAGCVNDDSCCGDGACDANGGENAGSCALDCAPTTTCGDGTCGTGETALNCANDCSVCGDELCSGSETVGSCPADCFVCGDDMCNGPESYATCPSDCNCTGFACEDGECLPADVACDGTEDCAEGEDEQSCTHCGDGQCNYGETSTSCAKDCASCGDGSCNGDETTATCKGDCPGCGDDVCNNGETPDTCAADCAGCGDGNCSWEEEQSETCQADCSYCGDNFCSENEQAAYDYFGECPQDCGTCGDSYCDWEENYDETCPADCDVCGDLYCSSSEWTGGACDVDCNYPEIGDECWDNEECGAGLVCANEMCAEPSQDGGACDDWYEEYDENDRDCVDGLVCIAGLCGAPRPLDGACVERNDCQPDLACKDGLCAAPSQAGETCSGWNDNDWCATELVCVEQYDHALDDWSYTCQDPTTPGSPCNRDDHCALGRTCVGEDYDGNDWTGACRDLGTLGQICEDAHECQAGYGCYGEACALRGGAGAACELEHDWSVDHETYGNLGDDTDCAAGMVCVAMKDATTALCAEPRLLGGVCGEYDDCDSSLRCVYGAALQGTCVAEGEVGDICDYGSDCAWDLVCVHEGTGGTCREPGDIGATCDNEEDCLDTLACKAHLCAERSPAGGSCEPMPNRWWYDGDHWYEDPPASDGEEEPYTDPRGDDRDCVLDHQCWNGLCVEAGELGTGCEDNSECNDDLVCRDNLCLPVGQAGEWCDDWDDAQDCAEGLSCDNGACATAEGLYAYCDPYDSIGCNDGFVCNDYRCRLPGQLGEACDNWWYGDVNTCAVGLECVEYVCIEEGSLGASCASTADCLDGLVCHYWDVCIEPAQEGEQCWDTPCADGLVCHGWDEVCVAPAQYGENCDDVACDAGLTCVWQYETDQYLCAFAAAEGDSCAAGSNAYCVDGLACLDEVCVPEGTEGTACYGYDDCLGDLVCSYAGTCRPAGQLGESCAAAPCVEGLACDYENELCTYPAQEGQSCEWLACADGLACGTTSEGTQLCATPAQDGESCESIACDTELLCEWSEAEQASYCVPSSFTCNDGSTIPRYWRCDEYEDCEMGEDEIGCAP